MKTGPVVLVGAVLLVLATPAGRATKATAVEILPASAGAPAGGIGFRASSVALAASVEPSGSPRALLADPSQVLEAWIIKDVGQDEITHIRIAIVPAAGTGGMTIAACSNPLVSPCIETIALSDPLLSTHVDALGAVTSVAASPGDDRVVAVLVRGTRASTSRWTTRFTPTVLLERDAAGDWTSEELPFLVDGAREPKLVYVRDLENSGAWIPAVMFVRASADASNISMLAERRGAGWESWKRELRELFSQASGRRSARWTRVGRSLEFAGP